MHGVLNDAEVEPSLQLIEGESFYNKSTNTNDNARLYTQNLDVLV